MFISSFFTVNYLVFLRRITFSGFFRHKAFPDLGEIDSVCRASNSEAFFFFNFKLELRSGISKRKFLSCFMFLLSHLKEL